MIILFLIIGSFLGVIAGLIPGLHVNNISKIAFLFPLFGDEGIVLILSMSIVQSFVDFVPAIFFGAPSTDTFEGILPGHQMFLLGEGHQAITLTVFGGIIATIISFPVLIIFIQFLEINNKIFPKIIPFILVFSIILLIFSEKNLSKKLIATFIIFTSATQGLLFENQLFPLITGYFGIATLIISNKKEKIVQSTKTNLELTYVIDGSLGLIGGAIVSIIPGIGNNLAAAIIRLFKRKIKPKNYLVLLGSINTSNFIFSLPVLFFLNKARNGTMIFINEELLLTPHSFFLGLLIILISAGIGGILTIFLSKKLCNIEFNTNKIEKIIIILLIILVLIFNGFIGIIALIFSTSLGLLAIKTKVKRSTCLGSIIVPVLFFYTFVLI